MKKRIAVLYGGAGAEHDVSVRGYQNIQKIIDREKYELLSVFIDKNASWYIKSHEHLYPTFPVRLRGVSGFFAAGQILPAHCVFPLLHGDFGEDGVIQGLLRSVGLPFVGEDVFVGSLCADKAYTKMVAESVGVPTVKYVPLKCGVLDTNAESICARELGYPMFIKPTSLGSSIGAGAVHTREDFLRVYAHASAVGRGSVLAECLVTDKREVECAVLNYNGEMLITHPSEIIINGTYGYEEKYKQPTKTCVRAEISDDVNNCLQEYSRKLINAIGIRAMSRIDYFITDDGVFLNEINTMPGFTESSMYLSMLGEAGIAPSSVIDTLIGIALSSTK